MSGAPETTAVTVTIDGRPIEARPGELLIAAAERHGVHIPRFCWHPRMSEVGMCRMCIVEVDTGRGPALQPSCMLPVSEGMVVDTQSETTKKAQDGILEFLLINHPLDCPVCDKGGECPLQDQTLAYGPGETRFVEEKRHFAKPIPISDLVQLDRERCILCDRCTRFAKEVAGDPLIHFQDRGNQTQVNTFPDDPFSSYFSGNTVQICPVGALTSSSYRFAARPWDLEEVESTCTSCSVGCRITVQSSRNEVVRYMGVDTDPLQVTGAAAVNQGWLCDKGRYGYEALNADERLRVPLVRDPADNDQLIEASWPDAVGAIADAVGDALAAGGPSSVAVLGGARLTNESAYAWSKLARSVIGTDNLDAQLGDGLPADVVCGLPRATIDEACQADTLLWIGPDPKEELPVLYLRLRAAVAAGRVRIVEVSPVDTSLTPLAKRSVRHRPGELGRAVAGLISGAGGGGVEASEASEVAEMLASGSLVVAMGRASLAESGEQTAEAVTALAGARSDATFLPVLRRGNVMGALDAGLSAGLLPGRIPLSNGGEHLARWWGSVPTEAGLDALGILEAAAEGRIEVLFLVGADPLADAPDRRLASRALAGARKVVCVDVLPSASTLQADIVLPAAAFTEVSGSTTNLEGRVSRLEQKVTAPGTARADWMIAAELAWRLGADLGLTSLDDIWTEMAAVSPVHAGMDWATLAGPAGADGVVLPLAQVEVEVEVEVEVDVEGNGAAESAGAADTEPDDTEAADTEAADTEPDDTESAEAPEAVDTEAADAPAVEVPSFPDPIRTTPREPSGDTVIDSYSLRLVVGRELYDQGVATAHAAHLAPLARGGVLRMNPADHDDLGIDDGTRIQAISARGRVVSPAVADPAVPQGVAVLAAVQADVDAGELIEAGSRFTEIRVETL